MTAIVSDILKVMDRLAPPSLAENWDNVGLQVGDDRWPVRTIWVSLDATLEVVQAACRVDVDLLITHHPLIFKPLARLDLNSPVGAIIGTALQHQMAIFAAHTNLDKTDGGLNDVLARHIGLKNLAALEKEAAGCMSDDDRQPPPPEKCPGLGRIGRLARPIKLESLARRLKTQLGIKQIRFVGQPDLRVTTAAICTGSGSGLMEAFFRSGAQVFISGDLTYHDARDVEAANLGLIDIGHFPSEHIIVEVLAQQLQMALGELQGGVRVMACRLEKDPFVIL